MLRAYFDDSGTQDNSPITVWAGFVGTGEQWSKLNELWLAKLSLPLPGKPELKKFGVADCRWKTGEFENYKPAESDVVRREFRQIIIQSGLVGIACGVDTVAYKSNVVGWANHFFGRNPAAFCLVGALEYTMQYVAAEHTSEAHVRFSFDRGQETDHIREMFRRGGSFYSRKYPNITSDEYLSVQSSTGLQAADMLATEAFWYFKEQRTHAKNESTPNPHFADLLNNSNIDLNYIDEIELVRMLKESRLYNEDR